MKRARIPVVLLLAATTVFPLSGSGPAVAASTAAAGAVSITRTIERTHLQADGTQTVASSKTVKVSVDRTQGLRGRQNIDVSWSGATPTGGIQPDLNAALASQQEYPMVLLECRGRDGDSVPKAQRLDPSTCWTHGPDERYQAVNYTRFGPWRMDRYATAAERAAVVGRPSSLPRECPSVSANEHWLPFRAVDGVSYPYGNNSCAGQPPEDYTFDSSAQVVPQNATFAPTGKDGTGQVKFNVWTEAENASLGCTASIDCTLVVIPIMGISCDVAGRSTVSAPLPADDIPQADDEDDGNRPAAVSSRCEAAGNYRPGSLANPSQAPDLAVSGSLWWSPSNWRNRISVPLQFAPVSNACEQTGGGSPKTVFGSELMSEATAQWAPTFCLDKSLFKLTHVQTAEPLARTLLADPTSGVHAAFSAQAPAGGFARPTVQAPVAITGFSISYNIDNDAGNVVSNLRMTPRLLAKLLTESYPADNFDRFKTGQFPYLHGNPINITRDPEFMALNPGITAANGLSGPAALITLSAESDVTEAVTSYINADPEARAWLDGTPDPWGIRVNPSYRKISLPLLRWPLLDTTLPDFGDGVGCTKYDPAPWLPLVASPTPTLASTTTAVQFAASPGKVGCGVLGDPGNSSSGLVQWISFGRMQPGQRFVIGITSLGEAARYSLSSASLQSHSDVSPTAKFTDASGRTFVDPTQASLAAAASHVRWNADLGTFTVPNGALSKDASAYPGTLPVYADVPVSGLSSQDAQDYAKLLRFAAGQGQQPGTGNGQLPDGYLPMTKANGLGALVDYTRRAATSVQGQTGVVTPLVPTAGGGSTAPSGPSGPSGGSGSIPIGSGGGFPVTPVTGGEGGGAAPVVPIAPPKSAPTTTGGAGTSTTPAAQTFATPKSSTTAIGVVVPVLFGLILLGGIVAGASRYVREPRRSA